MSQENQKTNKEDDNNKKTVAIRGIDERLYKEATKISREIGWTVGELINQSLKLFMTTFPIFAEKITESTEQLIVQPAKEFVQATKEALRKPLTNHYLISDLEEVVLDRKDLEHVDKSLIIASVKKVVINNDVDFELFDSKVTYIQFVDELVVPQNYPKIKLYAKLKHVKKITFI